MSAPPQILLLGFFLLFSAITSCQALDFDFFYLVLQWPGSFCGTSSGCCYPTTGKPIADFSLHGFWPTNDDGSYPSFCDQGNAFNPALISDLKNRMQASWETLACPSADGTAFWGHEWEKHGTCSESKLNEHDYFEAGLNLKENINLLDALRNAGIHPDGSQYSIDDIQNALKQAIGKTPGIDCNSGASGKMQLYQVYTCVGTDASTIIDCPVFPNTECPSQVTFPSF